MHTQPMHHRIVIIGGGTAGITVAARLRRAGERDIAVVEPSDVHAYQPLWTLVGGGLAAADESVRPEASVMPRGVRWIQDRAVAIDPEEQLVEILSGGSIRYDYLVVCPGIQLDFDRISGLTETLGRDGVSSNYRLDLAPLTWRFLEPLRGGTALFTMPAGAIKCGGAPQKIAYLAADHWRRQGVLKDIHVILTLPTPGMFGIPEFARVLEQAVDRYGIDVRFQHELVEVDGRGKRAVLIDVAADRKVTIDYDVMHVVPPQSAPDWLQRTRLAGPPEGGGYVEIDKFTLRHIRYPNVFSLGDAGSSPNSKTGAAIRKQAPVVVRNLLDVMAGRSPSASYHGYSSCPITTARNRLLLAEFDYDLRPTPSIPFIDTVKERYDMWLLKRYGLPALYWNLMLKGLA